MNFDDEIYESGKENGHTGILGENSHSLGASGFLSLKDIEVGFRG